VAAVAESSLNAEPRCIKVIDTFRRAMPYIFRSYRNTSGELTVTGIEQSKLIVSSQPIGARRTIYSPHGAKLLSCQLQGDDTWSNKIFLYRKYVPAFPFVIVVLTAFYLLVVRHFAVLFFGVY
jgi:hypothetical protein